MTNCSYCEARITESDQLVHDECGDPYHNQCLNGNDVCTACGGSGEVYNTSSFQGELINEGYEECAMCDGTGNSQ